MDSRRRDPRPGLLRALPRPRAQRRGPPPDPVAEDRSIGSVIKLLTPSPAEYTAEYNAWLDAHPAARQGARLRGQALLPPRVGRRLAQPLQRRDHQRPAGQLAAPGRRPRSPSTCCGSGFNTDGSWRLFSLRHDFSPAVKVQTQDDITASTVVPGCLHRASTRTGRTSSWRTARTCCSSARTTRSTAATTSRPSATSPPPARSCPTSQPLTRADAIAMRDDAVAFSAFTAPMAELISDFADTPEGEGPAYFVSSANPRHRRRQAHRRTPATCSRDPTGPTRARPPSRSSPAGWLRRLPLRCAADPAGGRRRRRPAQQPAGRPGARRCARTTRCTTWSCPSCSWSSSPR